MKKTHKLAQAFSLLKLMNTVGESRLVGGLGKVWCESRSGDGSTESGLDDELKRHRVQLWDHDWRAQTRSHRLQHSERESVVEWDWYWSYQHHLTWCALTRNQERRSCEQSSERTSSWVTITTTMSSFITRFIKINSYNDLIRKLPSKFSKCLKATASLCRMITDWSEFSSNCWWCDE